MPTLSVLMIVKNEEKYLANCLDSVADLANEIIIVDSGSTDNTAKIAQSYGAKFYSHTDWQGFGKQRQIAQQYATCDYVLWLDADERLSPELHHAIQQALQQESNQTFYQINRLSYAFGRAIRHSGWYPDYIVRLYPHELGQYNDAKVHETVVVPSHAPMETLSGELWHDTYHQLNQYLNKSIQYSTLWAEQNQHKTSSLASATFHALWGFIRMYIIKRGFLDGKQGFLLAVLSAQSIFNKYAQLWVQQHVQSTK